MALPRTLNLCRDGLSAHWPAAVVDGSYSFDGVLLPIELCGRCALYSCLNVSHFIWASIGDKTGSGQRIPLKSCRIAAGRASGMTTTRFSTVGTMGWFNGRSLATAPSAGSAR